MADSLRERVKDAYLAARSGLDDHRVSADLIGLTPGTVAVCGVLDSCAGYLMGTTSRARRVAPWLDGLAVALRASGFHVAAHSGEHGTNVLIVASTASAARGVSPEDIARIVRVTG